MSPTFEGTPRAWRDLRKLSAKDKQAFARARARFVEGLRVRPPSYDPALRVKRVRGSREVWELTFAPDGRATFRYGDEIVGEPHIVWLRVGDHSILDAPEG